MSVLAILTFAPVLLGCPDSGSRALCIQPLRWAAAGHMMTAAGSAVTSTAPRDVAARVKLESLVVRP